MNKPRSDSERECRDGQRLRASNCAVAPNGGRHSQYARVAWIQRRTGTACVVLSSTNIALPAANKTRVTTNFFDGGGQFRITNAVSVGNARQFFLLQVP